MKKSCYKENIKENGTKCHSRYSNCHPELDSGSRFFATTCGEIPDQVLTNTKRHVGMTGNFHFPLTPVLAHAALSLQGEGNPSPLRGKVDGVRMRGKSAFTLIEVLVVVLIIGILAAIALPQYQRAVEKSRVAEALHNAKLIEECFNWYQLEHGLPERGNVVNWEDMECPIDINLGQWDEERESYISESFEYYYLKCFYTHCQAEIYRYPSNAYALLMYRDGNSCITQNTQLGREICQSIRNQGWEYRDEEL